jgi:hypothetical protein
METNTIETTPSVAGGSTTRRRLYVLADQGSDDFLLIRTRNPSLYEMQDGMIGPEGPVRFVRRGRGHSLEEHRFTAKGLDGPFFCSCGAIVEKVRA